MMDSKAVTGSNSRLAYMDIAKGIAILAVLVGHFCDLDSIPRLVMFSFNLPLFFIISGFFVKDINLQQTVCKSGKSLLIPYVIGTVMVIIPEFWLYPVKTALDNAQILLVDMFGGFCMELGIFRGFHSTCLLWFLPCLFVARVLFVFIMKLTVKSNHQWAVRTIIFILFAFAGMVIGAASYYPWSIEIAFVTLPLLYFGYMLREHKALENKHRLVFAGIALVIWVIMLWQGLYIEFAMHYWPGAFLTLFESMIASFVVLCLAQLLDKIALVNRVLCWAGKNSLVILLFHNLEARYVSWITILSPEIIDKKLLLSLIRLTAILLATGVVCVLRYLWNKTSGKQKFSKT